MTWGEECLQACEMALKLCPGLAFPQWFITRVYIGRQAWDLGFEHAHAGSVAQDAQRRGTGCHAVGLHLLKTHLLFALRRLDEALQELARERAVAEPRHVFARECAGNTSYMEGALLLRLDRPEGARRSFEDARRHAPTHPLAEVGLIAVSPSAETELARVAARDVADIQDAIPVAAALSLLHRHADAARVYHAALLDEPPGPAGSMMPVDPLIDALMHRDAWDAALNLLRDRAI